MLIRVVHCYLFVFFQNAAEEVNVVRKGGNYGWPFFEGVDTLRSRRARGALGRQFSAPNMQTCALNAADTSRALVGDACTGRGRTPASG